jgi:ankyrin repeat protein
MVERDPWGNDRNIRISDGIRTVVSNRNWDAVDKYLTNYGKRGAIDDLGYCFIHFISCKAPVSFLKKFLEEYLPMQYISSELFPLHEACHVGHADAVVYLLQLGYDIRTENNKNETAIYMACRHGHASCMEILLANGASFDNSTKMISLFKEYLHEYFILERKYPNTDEQVKNFIRYVDVLVEHFKKSDRGKRQLPNVLYAICSVPGMVMMVQRLVEHHGCHVNDYSKSDTNNTLTTALYGAIKSNDSSIVKYLIEKGANIHDKCESKTPFHCAIAEGYLNISKLLLEAGSNLDARDIRCETPLFTAINNQNVEAVKFLLSNGANPNVFDTYGNTALMNASGRKDRHEIIPLLLSRNVEVNAYNNTENTALHFLANGNVESPEEIRLLVKRGAKVNDQNSYGYTPLHNACYMHNMETMKMLLRLGADQEMKNDKGRTPYELIGAPRYKQDIKVLMENAKQHSSIVFWVALCHKPGATSFWGNVPLDLVKVVKSYLL